MNHKILFFGLALLIFADIVLFLTFPEFESNRNLLSIRGETGKIFALKFLPIGILAAGWKFYQDKMFPATAVLCGVYFSAVVWNLIIIF